MMKRHIPWLCCLLLPAILAACGGAQTDTSPAGDGATPTSAAPAVVEETETTEVPGTTEEPPATPTSAEEAADGESADADELPLYPDAQPPARNSDTATLVELLQAQIEQQTGLENVQTETNGYVLPEGADFEQVRDFYREELAALGWETMEDATAMDAVAIADIGAASWSRNDDEVFIILVMAEPAVSESNILITVLGTPSAE